MIWISDQFGEQEVGHLRRVVKRGWWRRERWEWTIDVPLPLPRWSKGETSDCASSAAAFRLAFERTLQQTAAAQWRGAFDMNETRAKDEVQIEGEQVIFSVS